MSAHLVAVILIICIVIALVVGTLAFLAYRRVLRRAKGIERGLKMVPLLVHLPPPSSDTQVGNRDVRDVMREKVAQAEVLYQLLAGTFQSGFKSKFYGQRHIALEMIASKGLIHYFVAVPVAMVSVVEQAIVSAYPGARLEEVEDHNIFNPQGKLTGTSGGELTLRTEAAYPIETYKTLERDPMETVINSLSKIQPGEGAAIQIMIRPSGTHWAKRAAHLVAKKRRQPGASIGFSALDLAKAAVKSPEQQHQEHQRYQPSKYEESILEQIEDKMRHPGFETLVRIVASAGNYDRSQVMLRDIANAFSLFEQEGSNGFKFIPAKDIQGLVTAFIFRFFPPELRSDVLGSVELATVFHLPDAQFTPSTQLERQMSKQVDGPVMPGSKGLLFGYNLYRGVKKEIRLTENDRRRHTYIVGQTGTGKSTVLENLAVQDMLAGNGFAFIDPHGDVAEKLLQMVPKERAEDVIYFNPGDMDNPLGLNLFEFHSPEQKDFLVQESINMLIKLYDPNGQGIIGPRFEQWFRMAALTIMADPAGGTFIEVPKVFTDAEYLKQKFKYLTDPTVIDFWIKEMGQTSDYHKSEMLGFFNSKFGAFQSNEIMRNIIGQVHSGFDLRDIMDNKKILIVNLSKGQVGELNSKLLGMMFVMKIQAAAMSRSDIPEDSRQDFSLYVDEFQNFSTDSFASILSEARKYRLNLIVANQFIGQLTDQIRDAVFGNVGTIVAYRCGPEDAEFLSKQFEPIFDTRDLIGLPNHNAVMRLMLNNLPTQPFSISMLPPLGTVHPEMGLAVKQLSAAKFGVPRAVVEAGIFARLQGKQAPAAALVPSAGQVSPAPVPAAAAPAAMPTLTPAEEPAPAPQPVTPAVISHHDTTAEFVLDSPSAVIQPAAGGSPVLSRPEQPAINPSSPSPSPSPVDERATLSLHQLRSVVPKAQPNPDAPKKDAVVPSAVVAPPTPLQIEAHETDGRVELPLESAVTPQRLLDTIVPPVSHVTPLVKPAPAVSTPSLPKPSAQPSAPTPAPAATPPVTVTPALRDQLRIEAQERDGRTAPPEAKVAVPTVTPAAAEITNPLAPQPSPIPPDPKPIAPSPPPSLEQSMPKPSPGPLLGSPVFAESIPPGQTLNTDSPSPSTPPITTEPEAAKAMASPPIPSTNPATSIPISAPPPVNSAVSTLIPTARPVPAVLASPPVPPAKVGVVAEQKVSVSAAPTPAPSAPVPTPIPSSTPAPTPAPERLLHSSKSSASFDDFNPQDAINALLHTDLPSPSNGTGLAASGTPTPASQTAYDPSVLQAAMQNNEEIIAELMGAPEPALEPASTSADEVVVSAPPASQPDLEAQAIQEAAARLDQPRQPEVPPVPAPASIIQKPLNTSRAVSEPTPPPSAAPPPQPTSIAKHTAVPPPPVVAAPPVDLTSVPVVTGSMVRPGSVVKPATSAPTAQPMPGQWVKPPENPNVLESAASLTGPKPVVLDGGVVIGGPQSADPDTPPAGSSLHELKAASVSGGANDAKPNAGSADNQPTQPLHVKFGGGTSTKAAADRPPVMPVSEPAKTSDSTSSSLDKPGSIASPVELVAEKPKPASSSVATTTKPLSPKPVQSDPSASPLTAKEPKSKLLPPIEPKPAPPASASAVSKPTPNIAQPTPAPVLTPPKLNPKTTPAPGDIADAASLLAAQKPLTADEQQTAEKDTGAAPGNKPPDLKPGEIFIDKDGNVVQG